MSDVTTRQHGNVALAPLTHPGLFNMALKKPRFFRFFLKKPKNLKSEFRFFRFFIK